MMHRHGPVGVFHPSPAAEAPGERRPGDAVVCRHDAVAIVLIGVMVILVLIFGGVCSHQKFEIIFVSPEFRSPIGVVTPPPLL